MTRDICLRDCTSHKCDVHVKCIPSYTCPTLQWPLALKVCNRKWTQHNEKLTDSETTHRDHYTDCAPMLWSPRNKHHIYDHMCARMCLGYSHIFHSHANESVFTMLKCPQSAFNTFKETFMQQTVHGRSEAVAYKDHLINSSSTEHITIYASCQSQY